MTALIECLTVLLEYIYLGHRKHLRRPGPCHGHATAVIHVSTILKVLSLDFNTPFVYDKLVDQRMFTTLLMQLKAAVLVKVLHKLFVET